LSLIQANTIEGGDIATGGTPDANGYYWYKFDGRQTGLDLNLNSAANLGSRKVILLVDNADANIMGNINLTKGSGFFMMVEMESGIKVRQLPIKRP
jgi:hypothetical protein